MTRQHILLMLLTMVFLVACSGQQDALPEAATQENNTSEAELIIYSGRSEELVGPLMEQFQEQTGIVVGIRYGETAEMAATILEEGDNSPADIFFAQDAGALGALADEDRLLALPDDILDQVDARFRSKNDLWVGVSGRARVVAYNTDNVNVDDLPDSITGFTQPEWEGRIGWPPTNGSFQAFVTGLRVLEGEEGAREWLEGILANNPIAYPKNSVALEAVAAGEVDVAFINHYYLFRALAEQGDDYGARIYFLPGGDPGALINVAGAGIVNTSDNTEAAQAFVNFLLSEDTQQYFSETTYEYPLVQGVAADSRLPELAELETPAIDLTDLADLEGTLSLLQDVGALE